MDLLEGPSLGRWIRAGMPGGHDPAHIARCGGARACRWIALLSGRVDASLAVTGGVHAALDVVKSVLAGGHRAARGRCLAHGRDLGRITVLNDILPWMRAVIAVVDTPLFVLTDADGGFRFDDVAPGRYHLEVWHEDGRPIRHGVEVEKGEQIKLRLALAPRDNSRLARDG